MIGNYHPHGDDAAYDALVRLAQDWVMRAPLVHGQGNFGSVDGDTPGRRALHRSQADDHFRTAACRSCASAPCRCGPTTRTQCEEPVVLPAQFPNLLVNGSAGIAVGMATNIPPHNLGEVVRAAVLLIDNPEATTAQLMDKIKGPDFPLGGRIITDRATLRKIYEEGTGSIKVQGEWKLEEVGKKQQIVVTSIPYGVDKGKLESDIGVLINERKLPQLLNVTNEMNEKEGIRTVLEIKPGTDPNLVMAYLYKHTALQESFPVNLTCLVPVYDEDGKERTPQARRLGLKEMLRYFLDFRLATVRRRFEYELEQLRRRIHLLEGFRIIFNALDKAIKLIRESSRQGGRLGEAA